MAGRRSSSAAASMSRLRPTPVSTRSARLSDYGCTVSPADLFAHLFREMADTLTLWDSANGIGEIMASWRAVAGGIGETITVNLPNQSISGRFAGIDDTGLLKLLTDDGGMRLIAAGDVFFE